MEIAQAVNYKVRYKSIEGIGVFVGVYKGKDNNDSHLFENSQINQRLIVGEKDVIEIVTNGREFKNM